MTRTDTDHEQRTDGSPPLLQQYLAEHEAPCPGCGYNLCALTGDQCPECGQQLALRVELAEPKLAAFITGLVGLAASAGFSGLLLGWLAITLIVRGHWPGDGQLNGILVGGLVMSLALLGRWVQRRRWLRCQSTGKRWALVVFCCALPLLNLTVFALAAG